MILRTFIDWREYYTGLNVLSRFKVPGECKSTESAIPEEGDKEKDTNEDESGSSDTLQDFGIDPLCKPVAQQGGDDGCAYQRQGGSDGNAKL